ncbi:MAG TPA: VCBS repeat-containing protein [Gemmatimonadaceae bacterium]|nr:VCBS repeat-containing protein [Gemmatimonadaceae bacterium]
MPHSRRFALLLPLFAALGCQRGERPVFELLSADRTGVRFANTITTSDSLNVQTDPYIYNGGGVAAGDVDNDGLADLFFAGNMVPSRLYLNKGEMRFEDVTQRAGVATDRWVTGVTMVDINNDGFLDIYASVSGPAWSSPESRANLLFVNNGNRTFTEAAAQYGIADRGFSTQSAFVDYDGDGCLDLFVLNNSPADFSRSDLSSMPAGVRNETPDSYNQLYRNGCNGTFTNVSDAAGILRVTGYGLGVAVADVNRDAWPDIYVSNDVVANDVLYVNNRDGTFSNRAPQSLKHASFAGMGVDIADFNNDGWPDVLQVDMLPRALERRKRVLGFATYMSVTQLRARGVRDDYSANTLQLSNGVTKEGDVVFSEIGRLAGISDTDWSWSALFADFDNDGLKDIYISNGYPKAVNDLDYMTTTTRAMRPGLANASNRRALENLQRLPSYATPNYLFRNAGDLTFADKSAAWRVDQSGFSYGAAYVDLNNDGRLDLVVNNIDAPAFIYENVQKAGDAHHWLAVRLDGLAPNRRAVGATLVLTAGGQKQHLYQSPTRGYMSSVDDRLHFGLGRAARVDSLEVFWPDGRYQVLTGLTADRQLTVRQSDATLRRRAEVRAPAASPTAEPMFAPLEPSGGLAHRHETPQVVDFSVQPFIPYMISRQGPPLAVADVNGDGREDVFLGGVSGATRRLLLQGPDGRFAASAEPQPWGADGAYEDWGAQFLDANGDGLPDLYVASGGYQLVEGSPLLQDRLYVNRGAGRFVRDSAALPTMRTSTAVVRVGDFNGDGRPDLFVGGRLSPRRYPFPSRSYLLRNDGGRFTDVTQQVAPELVQPGGMVTDATWTDLDGDGRLDLVTVGEWMPIRIYRNEGSRLRDVTASTRLPSTRGWWYSIASGDFDRDGRMDLVAGNLGLNYTYATSKDSPFGVYAGEFSGGLNTDVVLTRQIGGTEYPLAGMVPLGRELYQLSLRFPTYAAFSTASMEQLFGQQALARALHYQVDGFASVVLRNDGGGAFSAAPLAPLAQIAPIKSIVVHDVDLDGHLDLIIAGNLYDSEPNTPRADAGNGLWLRGDGQGRFTPVSPRESGFLAPRNASGLALVGVPSGRVLLVANTGDSLQAFAIGGRRRPAGPASR